MFDNNPDRMRLYNNLGTELLGYSTDDVIAVLEQLLKEMKEEGNIHCR